MLWEMIIDNGISIGLGPGLIAALAALVAWRPWSDRRETAGGWWAGPVAVGGAYLVGRTLVHGWPELVPTAGGDWLIYATVAAVIVGVIESQFRRDAGWVWFLKIGVMAVGLYLVIQFMFTNVWESAAVKIAYPVGIVGLSMLSMWTLEQMSRRHPGVTMPIVMHIMATGAALVITFGHSASTGQMLGTLATATAVFAVVALWKGQGRVTLARGGVTVFTVVLTLVLADGYFNVFDPNIYAKITTPAIVASPLVLWIGEFPPLSEMDGVLGVLVRAGLMGAAAAAIVGVAYLGW